ncbi:helix-turn-helix transcriptional regulator [Providencia zhijiangensis]|uniref:Helix-turn-helix transcriptional regulator n=1 Tax=Providencia zhijiangensis TaxID=3053982 RepID=A0ABZ0N3I5_9GAMM|nr:helix-turn-helix transcriptional regulator [Providencia sp. D4759]WPA92401.1 helix-turn-helix transcriptional regulator [Providencia sp. D4759]
MHENHTISEIIGHKIKLIREHHHLSLKELADEIGICEFQQLKYEKGKDRIPVDKLKQYADYFEISLLSFFIFSEAEKKFILHYLNKK